MQQSSSTIGAIAGALAKAQTELSNPEKSLTAHILNSTTTGKDQTFRYAPLSAGLEIVRKCLGKNEIALTQSTVIDKEAGVVRLVTLLAHTSGEWISSDWPVCLIAHAASPQKMGAALTYARRYALFSLVGIAGEDDTDAPDLEYGVTAPLEGKPPRNLNGPDISPLQSPGNDGPDQSSSPTSSKEILLADLDALTTADALLAWALKVMPIKNNLQATEAEEIEDAFRRKTAALADSSGSNERSFKRKQNRNNRDVEPRSSRRGSSLDDRMRIEREGEFADRIDKSALTLAVPKRHRNKAHLRFVSSQSCLICARQPSDAHHLRFAQPKGLGQKVSDEFTVPLCRVHHREVHRASNASKEREWWENLNIDPLKVASELWQKTTLGIVGNP